MNPNNNELNKNNLYWEQKNYAKLTTNLKNT